MTSAPTATRLLSPLFAMMASLVCTQAACSMGSLDYLQSGARRDGAIGNDQGMDMSASDTVNPSDALLDATEEEAEVPDAPVLDAPRTLDSSKPDGLIRDGLVLDARSETGNNQVVDTSTPDRAGSDRALDAIQGDGAVLDSPGRDAPQALDSSDTAKADALSRADMASGGGAGTADAGASQDGASGGTDGSTAPTACSGALYQGICWYLGPQGSSCQAVCASHGQAAPNAASYVGTTAQGGSLAKCGLVLGLLGITGTPSANIGLAGLGCFVRANGTLLWQSFADFSATASQANAKLVCGCTQ